MHWSRAVRRVPAGQHVVRWSGQRETGQWIPKRHRVCTKDVTVGFVTQIDTTISTLPALHPPTDRPAAGQLPSAVNRRQTNGILCLIDDDHAEGGKSGIGGWDQSSAVMSLIDMWLWNIYATSSIVVHASTSSALSLSHTQHCGPYHSVVLQNVGLFARWILSQTSDLLVVIYSGP